ncbi:transcription cofactor vestigial-like protein 2 isoform X1 [Parasteatoda tepidariorum]|uniref:transcription cofactor vestigial-like protein 2 isoform X1 n=1 Tax=Parasteatoda tepidariorum TaxID=114398 RepID=UPI001C721B18|nr:transcription cofactor vestigial-like protein 2 isoform X1 [Parasteatoda tepidariorum]
MSCADVMYQPYSPYFPYHQRSQVAVSSTGAVGPLAPIPTQVSADYRKFTSIKSHTDTSPSSLDPTTPAASPIDCRSSLPSAASIRSPPAAAAASSSAASSTSEGEKNDKAEAQYLSANCVLFTYYSGDISSVVDEHFARALSQVTSYSPPETAKAIQAKDGPPMSHRNFPPSFWNSNYQPMTTSNIGAMTPAGLGGLPPDLTYGGDPYHHHPGTLHATLHHQNDPWHYTLTGQPGHFGHHRSHELTSYHPSMSTVAGASRFTPQYGSLLLQPSVRSAARLGPAAAAACASLEKSAAESWGTSRYHDPIGHMDSNYGAAYGPMTEAGFTSVYNVLHSMQMSYR